METTTDDLKPEKYLHLIDTKVESSSSLASKLQV